jgi:hypothetical protein
MHLSYRSTKTLKKREILMLEKLGRFLKPSDIGNSWLGSD